MEVHETKYTQVSKHVKSLFYQLINGVYTGEWSDGKPHGYGIHKYRNGYTYEGDFLDGKRSGYGKLTFPNGDIYEGEWCDDKRNGNGKMITHQGKGYFIGKWQNDYLHGYGRSEIYGYTYEGTYLYSMRHGSGTYTHNKCIYYDGQFLKNMKHGQGKEFYEDGNLRYEGSFETELYNGYGTFYFDNTQSFVKGWWHNGKIHGYAKLKYANKYVYKGQFRNGVANGYGRQIINSSTIYTGEFINGVQQGMGILQHENEKYTGEFVNGCINGVGIHTFSNNDRVEGTFFRWKCGSGIYIKTTGDIIQDFVMHPKGLQELNLIAIQIEIPWIRPTSKDGTFYEETLDNDHHE